ncbi:MAG: hypothetical protein ACOYEW_09285 [Anaerolineae bacterium]|jgi:hypothetical protein
MEESLSKINAWASRGTLEQFYSQVQTLLDERRFNVELVGNSLMFYQRRKEGGILGLGAKPVRRPVMRVSNTVSGVQVQPQPLDPAFAEYLAGLLPTQRD